MFLPKAADAARTPSVPRAYAEQRIRRVSSLSTKYNVSSFRPPDDYLISCYKIVAWDIRDARL